VKKIFLRVAVLCAVAVSTLAVLAGLVYCDLLWFNSPSLKRYPIRGVDVSSYQGEIDWKILADQNIHFAFIKATEGSSYQDASFDKNFDAALKTPLKIGAYHFFSFDSPGETQARNFITRVPNVPGTLPPVVDIEPDAKRRNTPENKEKAQSILHTLLAILEAHYGKKPILYVTQSSYEQYVRGAYEKYPLWIRDIFRAPHLPDQRQWVFWQYSSRGRLEGYKGMEKHIDLNVFHGSAKEFSALTDMDAQSLPEKKTCNPAGENQ
jgi:lysozyme